MVENMKIAFVTDDGENISAHFGRAAHYLVVDIEDGHEIGRELREKMGHAHFHNAEHQHEHQAGEAHGFDPQSQGRHTSMLEAITDCSVVVCGGMGQGAMYSIQTSGKDLRLTDVSEINQALQLFLAGNLPNQVELSH
jgi:predicted Fe-Mo cluster-binding NifX family protein